MNIGINNRPGWVNIGRGQVNNIGNRWGNQIGGLHGWHNRYPDRVGRWHGWGNGVRDHWRHNQHGWFGPGWWGSHRHGISGWHYQNGYHNHSSNYWWTVPSFVGLTSWFNWNAPAATWSEPIYYAYGQGGNVTYENNVVYVNGQEVATADEFAQSAAVLATVPPPESDEQAEEAEWMALGTFAIATNEKDVDPSRAIQLAVNKEGIISGTLFNSNTDRAQTVQGQVDKQTQRVAFRMGDSDDVVVETGLYNLTQDEAPAMVHFGTDRVENYLLVRLEQPDDDNDTVLEKR